VYGQNDVIKLSFTLKNTGKTNGSEIAQVYVSQPKALVPRPVKELKAFKKVFLKAGETQTVELEINVKDIAYYSEKAKTWVVDTGEFIFSNAASSAEIKSKVSVFIK